MHAHSLDCTTDALAPFSHHQEGHPNAAEVVPLGWRLQPNDPSWRGNRFVSPDGSSWFAAYSSPIASEPVAAHMHRITIPLHSAGTRLARSLCFERQQDILSKGCDRVRRQGLASRCFRVFTVRKRQMDPFVVRAARSIDHAEYDSCEEPRSSATQ
jgi:hypothetical protein